MNEILGTLCLVNKRGNMKIGTFRYASLLYFLLILTASASMVPILEINPTEATPGEEVAVKIQATEDSLGCDDTNRISNVHINIGSVSVGNVLCDSQETSKNYWLRFTVPTNRSPAPGWQDVRGFTDQRDEKNAATQKIQILPLNSEIIAIHRKLQGRLFDLSAIIREIIKRKDSISGGKTFLNNLKSNFESIGKNNGSPLGLRQPYSQRGFFGDPSFPNGNSNNNSYPYSSRTSSIQNSFPFPNKLQIQAEKTPSAGIIFMPLPETVRSTKSWE